MRKWWVKNASFSSTWYLYLPSAKMSVCPILEKKEHNLQSYLEWGYVGGQEDDWTHHCIGIELVWWLKQPIWNILLVKLDLETPSFGLKNGENRKCLKPPTREVCKSLASWERSHIPSQPALLSRWVGIIFHQARFPWNKGSHFPSKKLHFGVVGRAFSTVKTNHPQRRLLPELPNHTDTRNRQGLGLYGPDERR